jgi:adenylate cyclase
MGEQSLKNIARPLRVYCYRGLPAAATELPATALPLPDKPSLAVLPFQNLTGDAEQDYFVDGMVEEITTAIARLPWLFVIARNSAFTYKGKPVDVKQVAQQLGVRYVLEGSVRKAANRVRISGQLIDTTTGAHIWANRFDAALDDIFELQDQVASSVAGAIEPKLRQSEIERANRKPAVNLTAYDLYLRALAQSYRFTEDGFAEAVIFARQALAIDPPTRRPQPWSAGVGGCSGCRGGGRYPPPTSPKPVAWPARCSKRSAMTPTRFGKLPGPCLSSPARRRWRRRLSIAPWCSTRTRLTRCRPEG